MTNELLIASSVLQWVALCAGGIVLLGIARQVGLLHERSAPLGAMITDHGPGIGDKAPSFSIIDVKGQKRQIGGEDPAGMKPCCSSPLRHALFVRSSCLSPNPWLARKVSM